MNSLQNVGGRIRCHLGKPNDEADSPVKGSNFQAVASLPLLNPGTLLPAAARAGVENRIQSYRVEFSTLFSSRSR
jgi:hypothetical protein